MSELLNEKYNVELEVLTPLHIGAGAEKDWMKGADYISDNGKVYILNHKKVLKNLKGDANEFSNFLLTKDDRGLKNKLSGSLETVSDTVFISPTGSENDIKTFIKNGLTNKPIVPGSSLKGAIRSVLLSNFVENRSIIDRRNRRFEEDIFGSANKGDEFMRFVKIADAQFDRTELINTKIFNLFLDQNELSGGWKHKGGKYGETNNKYKSIGFNTIYEIIPRYQKSLFSFSLAKKALENLVKDGSFRVSEKKKEIINSDISSTLFLIINEHTKKYINKQIAFFNKYQNDKTEFIVRSLENLKEQIPNDNSSCVLQMSAGSGFHSITGDWQFDDFSISSINGNDRNRGMKDGDKSAKSRKIATDGETFDLMGFVKLTTLTNEKVAQYRVEQEVLIEAERKAADEKLEKEKAEQQRLEILKREKIEEELKAEEEKLAQEKVEQERKETLKREKLETEQKAKEDFERQQKADAKKLKEAQEKNRLEREKRQQELLEEGLIISDDLEAFDTGKKIVEDFYKAKGQVNIEGQNSATLKAFIGRCINKSNKRWKKLGKQDWKLVEKWVGKTTAQNWYNEIIKK